MLKQPFTLEPFGVERILLRFSDGDMSWSFHPRPVFDAFFTTKP